MSRGGETTEGAVELLVITQVGRCWWVETGCGLNLHRIVPKIVPMEKNAHSVNVIMYMYM